MSSREIAELTGKQHKDVLYDIRSMLEQLGLTSADFSAYLPDAYGRRQPAFVLPKDLTITLVSGYNVTMRHRIVTRWQELEEQNTFRLPQNLGDALQLAADNWETAKAQALQGLTAARFLPTMRPVRLPTMGTLRSRSNRRKPSIHAGLRAIEGFESSDSNPLTPTSCPGRTTHLS